MRKALSPREAEFLSTLAEYRVLSVSQLSQLLSASQQMTRRKAGELSKAGLIEVMRQPLTGSAGRPENVAYLRVDGVQTLKEQGALDSSMANDLFTKIDFRTLEHQLLTNWFRIHLSLLSRYRPSLSVNFLSPVRHHDWYATGFAGSEPMTGVIPDAAFVISETTQGKSLLFFLEVDMGTETLASKNPQTKDIRKKALAYQQIFTGYRFKELESPLGGVFKGFRTLLLTSSRKRLIQLCHFVAAMPNTGFIWLTDSDSLSQRGVSAAIWVKGGDVEQGHRSILGPSMAFDYSLSPSE